MFLRVMTICLLAGLFLTAPSRVFAGCPAYPPELAGIKVHECRFYDPAKDAAFVEKIGAYFSEHWKGEEAAKRIGQTLAQNTGLIVAGEKNGDDSDGKTRDYFFRTQDSGGCAQFEAGQSYIVHLHRTCPMVFFEAPASIVITRAAGDDLPQDALFSGESVIDKAVAVPPPPAVHVDDNAVLGWAEGAVASAFAKGIAGGDENPLPEFFTDEGWASFRRAAGGGIKPVEGLLNLADPIIVQKLTQEIGADNAWAIDWDCDFTVVLAGGDTRRVTHISAFVRRLQGSDGTDSWAVSELGLRWNALSPEAE